MEEFYRHPKMADGRLGKCKDCTKADVRVNRERNVEHYRNHDVERSKDPSRRAAAAAYHQRWKAENPEKRRAQVALGNALRDGKIVKPEACSQCGGADRVIHGHHEDYGKPLDVIWVCPPCHKAIHSEEVV